MGYSVYWHNNRWQGYGVPAYCDHLNCKEEIDRGLGYAHHGDKDEPPNVFVCSKHDKLPLSRIVFKSKEHPDWIKHILTDKSWSKWRKENKEKVKALRGKV